MLMEPLTNKVVWEGFEELHKGPGTSDWGLPAESPLMVPRKLLFSPQNQPWAQMPRGVSWPHDEPSSSLAPPPKAS